MGKKLFIIAFLFSAFAAQAAGNVDAQKILEKSKQKLALINVHLVLELETSDAKGNEKGKSMDVTFAEFGTEKKVMVEVTAPENLNGMKILTTDFEDKKGIIEIYMPATGKIQKIRASQRNIRMLGSEIPINQFSAALDADFDFNLIGEKMINGENCYEIMIGKEGEKTYELAYVTVETEQLIRLDAYVSGDKLATRTDMTGYMKVVGTSSKMYPQEIKVQNFKNGKSSLLRVKQVDYLNNVSQDDFQLVSKAS